MGMKLIVIALGALVCSACGVGQYTASTEASYSKDGTWTYRSNKNQESFEAKLGEDRRGNPVFEVKTTATTPEAAIAAAMQSFALVQQQFAELLKQVGPLIAAGARAGALSGS